MTKKDDSGEMVAPKGSRPVRAEPLTAPRPGRRFPFRLLLWALLMTATTAGAGYYAYRFYQAKETAKDERIKAMEDKDKAEADLLVCTGDANNKQGEIDACNAKVASLQKDTAQLDKMSKDLKTTEVELKELRAQKAVYEERLKSIDKFRKEFENLQSGLKVRGRRGNLVVSLDSEILFKSASAELEKEGEYAIVQVGGVLKQFPDRKFLVIGHTDKAPLKSNVYKDNWDLSAARATTVVRVLKLSGVKPENLIAAGAGEFDPIDEKSFAKNRRIEIVLLPAVAELPPLPEGVEDVK